MRQAVLDIGTNTVKLLVADILFQPPSPDRPPSITPILEDARTTRVGEGVHQARVLNPAAVERTLDAVAEFVSRARALDVEKVFAFATSALRDARNGSEFLDAVRNRTGIMVTILSGDDEARCAFAGVTSDPAFSGRPIRTIDIGGGSTEICLGDARRLRAHQSLNIGAVRLTEMFLKADPPTNEEFANMQQHIRAAFRTVPTDVVAPAGAAAAPWFIATGGTATTLAAIELRREKNPGAPARVHLDTASDETRVRAGVDHHELTTLPELVNWLRKMRLAERKKVDGLPTARADIIVAGAAILDEATKSFGARTVTVSVRGLRYGALALGFGGTA